MTEGYNKGSPGLRISDLTDESTRYDVLVAAPPNEDLVKYWYSWASIAGFVGLLNLVVFLGIISDKATRRKPFNLYLVFLLIPDFMFSLLCGTTCLVNALNGEYLSHWMCNFQQFYCVFGIGANAWMNAVIAFQLHKILRDSHQRRRYMVPSSRQIYLQSLAVYLWCLFLASWGLYDTPAFPFHSGQISGLACLPVELDQASTIFFWLLFFPCFAGFPVLYVLWVCWDVYRKKLLPPAGKRRLLSIYFGRLVLVFLVFWVPTLLILFAFAPEVSVWVRFAGGTWSHLQGCASAIITLLKPDIAEAVKNFITCKCSKGEETNGLNGSRRRTSAGLGYRFSNDSQDVSIEMQAQDRPNSREVTDNDLENDLEVLSDYESDDDDDEEFGAA